MACVFTVLQQFDILYLQAAGDAYPYYKVADRPAPPPGIPQPPCQACTSCGRAMEKSVQLMGGAYSRDTLELQGTEAMEPRVSEHELRLGHCCAWDS